MTHRATITPAQYLAKLPSDRRAMIDRIRRILKTRSALQESVGGTPGSKVLIYTVDGQYAYGLASRKDGIRFYSMSIYVHAGLRKKYAETLGKYLVGKSCMRFRKQEEIDEQVLRAFVKDVAKIRAVKI